MQQGGLQKKVEKMDWRIAMPPSPEGHVGLQFSGGSSVDPNIVVSRIMSPSILSIAPLNSAMRWDAAAAEIMLNDEITALNDEWVIGEKHEDCFDIPE
jgi:hypothetical protein